MLLVLAGTVAVVPGAPLGVITLAVQALCGLMLPSTTIIVLMLANDRELMGPWKNGRILNVVAVFMVVVLVVLSLTLMISTLFTGVHVLRLLEVLAAYWARSACSWDCRWRGVDGSPRALLRRQARLAYATAGAARAHAQVSRPDNTHALAELLSLCGGDFA